MCYLRQDCIFPPEWISSTTLQCMTRILNHLIRLDYVEHTGHLAILNMHLQGNILCKYTYWAMPLVIIKIWCSSFHHVKNLIANE